MVIYVNTITFFFKKLATNFKHNNIIKLNVTMFPCILFILSVQ